MGIPWGCNGKTERLVSVVGRKDRRRSGVCRSVQGGWGGGVGFVSFLSSLCVLVKKITCNLFIGTHDQVPRCMSYNLILFSLAPSLPFGELQVSTFVFYHFLKECVLRKNVYGTFCPSTTRNSLRDIYCLFCEVRKDMHLSLVSLFFDFTENRKVL